MSSSRAVPKIALSLACTIGLAACTGGSGEPTPTTKPPKQTTTPTAAPTTSTSLANTYKGPASVPMAARARTDAGRIAFAKHYVDQINETGKNPKVGVLEPLSTPACAACEDYIGSVAKLKNKSHRYTGNSFQITSTKFPEANHNVVELLGSQPEIEEVDIKGARVQISPRYRRIGIVFYLKWDDGWLINDIKLDNEATKK